MKLPTRDDYPARRYFAEFEREFKANPNPTATPLDVIDALIEEAKARAKSGERRLYNLTDSATILSVHRSELIYQLVSSNLCYYDEDGDLISHPNPKYFVMTGDPRQVHITTIGLHWIGNNLKLTKFPEPRP